MFGPGQPIVGTPQTPVPQAGYSSAVGPVISIDEIEGRVRSDNLQIQMMDRQLKALEDMDVSEAVNALNTQANQLTQLATQLQNMLPQIQDDPL